MDSKDYPHPKYYVLDEDGFFKDFLGSIILNAPDNLHKPRKPPEWQIDLNIAFDIMRAGADMYCAKRRRLKGEEARLHAILDKSIAAYQAGERQTGMDEIYRFEVAIFGHIENGKRTYEYFPELDDRGVSASQKQSKKNAERPSTTVVTIAGLGEIANFDEAYQIAKAKFGDGTEGL